jgi:hypothetical protein
MGKLTEATRHMPDRVNLGRAVMSTMALPMLQWSDWKTSPNVENPSGLRTIMGYALPTWQRGLVWSEVQDTAFVESAWRGIPLGTYTYNRASMGSPYDNLLIDGQQRLHAIERYLSDVFPVFGYLWSEVTQVDRRFWEMGTVFHSFVTETEDEDYLRNYYDLLNFGGVRHEEHQRAGRRALAQEAGR